MKKFKVTIKSIQEATFTYPEEAWGEKGKGVTVKEIMKMEEYNVRSDPTYFSFLKDSTEDVTVEVEEINEV
jgi:hypothetical protein